VLLLTRNVGQEIIIGDDLIRIMLMQINGRQARLGITAPLELEIHRLEIYEKIKRGEHRTKSMIIDPNDMCCFDRQE